MGPLRQLHDEVVKPIAVAATKGAWYRRLRLVSLDGSTLDVADESRQRAGLRSPGRESRHQRLSAAAVCVAGRERHPCAVRHPDGGLCDRRDHAGQGVLRALRKGMLCLADRNFFGFALWVQARSTGADLLWRVKNNARLPREQPCSTAPI